MEISVLYFAMLREITGRNEERLEVRDGSTAADLIAFLSERYPKLARHNTTLAVASADRIVERDKPLAPGETIALIPPVSGG